MSEPKPYTHRKEYPTSAKMDGPRILIAIHNAAAQGYERFEINLKTMRGWPVRVGSTTVEPKNDK